MVRGFRVLGVSGIGLHPTPSTPTLKHQILYPRPRTLNHKSRVGKNGEATEATIGFRVEGSRW